MATITAPVSIAKVKSVLGVSENSLGRLIYDTAESGGINYFSKYKPIYHAGVGQLTEAQLYDGERTPALPSTQIVRYGVMHAVRNNLNASKVKNGLGSWDYDYPQGGTNSPYRLHDFNNYNHNAPIPFAFSCPADMQLPIADSSIAQTSIGFRFRMNYDIAGFQPSTCLSLCQVTVNGVSFAGVLTNTECDMYPAIAIMPMDSNLDADIYIVAASVTLKNVAQTTSGQYTNGVTLILDIQDLVDSFGYTSTYFTEGKKWKVRFMLTQYSRTGKMSEITTPGLCLGFDIEEFLNRGYADYAGKTLTVKRVSWVKYIKKVTLTTTLRRVGTDQYSISSAYIVVTYTGSRPYSFAIAPYFYPVCVPGTVNGTDSALGDEGLYGNEDILIPMSGSGSVGKTYPETLFTGNNIYYKFTNNASIPVKMAILAVSLYTAGYEKSYGMEVSTQISCLDGASSYTQTATWENPHL